MLLLLKMRRRLTIPLLPLDGTDAGSSELDPDCTNPVVIYMPEISKTHLGGTMRLGLRPSLFTSGSEKWSKIRKLYGGAETVWERHRHRYEINPEYLDRIERGDVDARKAIEQNGYHRPSTPVNKGLRSLPTSPSLNRNESFVNDYSESASQAKPSTDRLCFVGKSESGDRMQIAELITAKGQEPHPYYVGMQAHPEFASRPLNPSPPFLGFVAAAANVLEEQIAIQANYKPPHPPMAMKLESENQIEVERPATTPPGAVSPKQSSSSTSSY